MALTVLLAQPDATLSNTTTSNHLDDRFKTFDDLDELESLVLNVQQRHEELRSGHVLVQLSHSLQQINTIISNTRASAEDNLNTAQELSLHRHSLADDLSELSSELTSSLSDDGTKPTLLEDLETLHRNLKELESVKGYVQVIQHALLLRESAIGDIRSTQSISVDSVAHYRLLKEFVEKISVTSSKASENGNGTLHLVEFLKKLQSNTWKDMRNVVEGSLLSSAEKLGWPMPIEYVSISSDDRKAFESALLNLTRLQTIGEKMVDSAIDPVNNGLYAVQALVQPISLRFKYHFEGTRQTNRLDKPEWYFTHILNATHEHRNFLETVIQGLLSSTDYKNINAWREFVLHLLPILSRKLLKTIPSILQKPSLLAHTIYQALSFDAALLEQDYSLQGTTAGRGENNWSGISDIILGNKDWFESWLSGEKEFILNQYREAIDAPDAWLISEEEDDSGASTRDLKATNSARRIKSFMEQVTDRYALLPQAAQRIQFLTSIQLPVLDSYHSRIVSSLEAYETLSSAFVRAVPGALTVNLGGKEEGGVNVDTRRLTHGVDGVQRLCKALLSAVYTKASLSGWGDELFFVELWADINNDAVLREKARLNTLLPNPAVSNNTTGSSETIFEALISKYKQLVTRAEDMIVQQVCGEVEGVLKSHLSASNPPSTDSISISQTLIAPIALLSSHLTQLRHTLSEPMFTSLYRRTSTRIAEHILQRQIMYRGHFDLETGKVIHAECELWVESCLNQVGNRGGRQRAESPWSKLLEAGRLVGLQGDAWKHILELTFGNHTEEEWEQAIVECTGFNEFSRKDVIHILRRRSDCL